MLTWELIEFADIVRTRAATGPVSMQVDAVEKGKGEDKGKGGKETSSSQDFEGKCFCCDQVGHMKKGCQKRNSDMAFGQKDGCPFVDMRKTGRSGNDIVTAPWPAASTSTLSSTSSGVLAAPIMLQTIDVESIIDRERFVFALTERSGKS